MRFILERALSLVAEVIDLTLRPSKTWSPHLVHVVSRWMFISWEPSPPSYLKVNFDCSVRGRTEGAGYIIQDWTSKLTAARGIHLHKPLIPTTKLHVACARITYACWTLRVDHLSIEGDSSIVISWIQRCTWNEAFHPLLRDIATSLSGCVGLSIKLIFQEMNSTVDWVAIFITKRSRSSS